MTTVFDERARLLGSAQVAAETFELSFHSPRIAAAAGPGQFVNVLLPSPGFGYRCFPDARAWLEAERGPRATLLRRPFSVYRVTPDERPETLDILMKVVGEGTRQLASLAPGAEVRLLGPLGRSFALPPGGAIAALVAGGCGWASLGLLARELRRRAVTTYAFIGAATEAGLPLRTHAVEPRRVLDELPEACVTAGELEELGVAVALAAESGGRVYGGVVTDLLEAFLSGPHASETHLYACGPRAMLRTVARLAREHGRPCQVALEERMGCGVGVCNSCVVEVARPDGSAAHKKLCTDGPVLDAAEVLWDEEEG
jgi:dihydroorotate dehydrogenase electron transfer subunit